MPIINGVAGPTQVIAGTDFIGEIVCPSPSTCVAVGGIAPCCGVPSVGGFVIPITDGTAGPAQFIGLNVSLFSIACTDASHCVAVGADPDGGSGVVVAIDDGVAGPYQVVPGTGPLLSVACTTSCVAVGTLGDPHGRLRADGQRDLYPVRPGGRYVRERPLEHHGACGRWRRERLGRCRGGRRGTYNWMAMYSGDLNNLSVSSECGSEPVVITPQTLRGRAYGLAANASLLGLPLINRPPTPDTGEIATTLDSSTSVPYVATLSGPLLAHVLCASVTTTAFPAGSTAAASVADLSLSVATLPTIKIGAVHSTSTTSCDGSTGAATIAYLKIGSTVVIATPTLVAPNTHVTVGPVSLVLNEQVPGLTGGLTVNGVHLSVNGGGLAQTNLVVGSARSGIGNCP